MLPTRRQFLAAPALTLAARAGHAGPMPLSRMGLVLYSYGIRSRQEKDLAEPLRFLDWCRARGAGGMQLPLGMRDADYLKKLRGQAEKKQMFVEGSIRPPQTKDDTARFEAEVRAARAAGVEVLRTVMLSGRRYEVFKTLKEYRSFKEGARRSLELAEPIVSRHKVRLAVENHKDFRAAEQVEMLNRLGSERVGICVDLGNNLALLEDPVHTVTTLAPLAYACHVKDMAVEEMPEGFLLSEVALGEGMLDLSRLLGVLRKARPNLRFTLEMITRDPLRIPCLSESYWATFDDVPARDLAATLALVRRHAGKKPLPRVFSLPLKEQLAVEDQNVRRSLAYARARLGL